MKTNDEKLAEVLAAQTYDERMEFAAFITSIEFPKDQYEVAAWLSSWVEENLPADEEKTE